MMNSPDFKSVFLGACVAWLFACSPPEAPHDDGHDHTEPMAEADAPTDPNRIAIPEAVRQNLGITFVRV